MQKFMDNDKDYLDWVALFPNGYVVNILRSLNPNNVVLHKATCWTIKGKPARGESWTDAYIKICSTSMAKLESWVKLDVGGTVRKCMLCNP